SMLSPTRCPPLLPYTTLFRSPPQKRKYGQPQRHFRGGLFDHALPAIPIPHSLAQSKRRIRLRIVSAANATTQYPAASRSDQSRVDRKSTRLNSSHVSISYAVF